MPIDIPFAAGIISFTMHKTFAHISVATEADIGLPSLLAMAEAHEETWEASTTDPQTYETTIEHQAGGLDRRRIAGCEYLTETGTFSIFAAGTRVEAEEIPAEEPNRVTYLRLKGPLAAAIERTLEVAPERPLVVPKAPARLAFILAEATGVIFDRSVHWSWRLIETLADLTRTLDDTRHRPPTPTVRLVDRARALVEESPQRPWSVKELATLLGVRREALWEQFSSQTGQSPGDWIRQHRIRVAESMLARGLSVRETASRLGFSSRQQFARTYRTVTGRAPSLR